MSEIPEQMIALFCVRCYPKGEWVPASFVYQGHSICLQCADEIKHKEEGWGLFERWRFRLGNNPTENDAPKDMKSMFGIMSDELEEHFPKHGCKERGEAIVLIAQILIKVKEVLEKRYKDKFMKKFLSTGGTQEGDDACVDGG